MRFEPMTRTRNDAALDTGAMIEGMRRWVEIESPTYDPAAVNRVMDCVINDLRDLPLHVERIAGPKGFGDTVAVRTERAGAAPGILILSHLDTVHPIGTLSRLPFRRDGNRLFGPGVYDMKGGAYMALEALRRVLHAGTPLLPVTHLFTPDEEIGSPATRALIEAEAKRAKYVLVTEPARDGGKVVTSRKGVARFDVMATGRAAHAGSRHEAGRSAIKEMARQALAIEAMTDYARGVTATVGTIAGGTAPNVVPQHCRMSVDLRVCDDEAGCEMVAKISGLRAHDRDVELSVTGGMNRPPFAKSEASHALFRHARALAADIGFPLVEAPMTGGGSDGNFTAALGVPTLDGLGIDGDGAHTEWEHGLVSSIAPRTLLMQRLIETLP